MASKACEGCCALHCWRCASMHVVMTCAFASLLSPLAERLQWAEVQGCYCSAAASVTHA